MTRVKTLSQRHSVRYLLVGGTVYALEIAIILLAQHFGASPVLSVTISYVVGTVVSFLLQKLVTFGDKRTHHKVLLPQILAVSALVGFNFLFTLLATKLLAPHLPTIVIRTLALGVTTLWNFYLYKMHIFTPSSKKPKKKKGKQPAAKLFLKRCAAIPVHIRTYVRSRRLTHFYMLACLLVLFATTVLWAGLGAHVQNSNADQLADVYLFKNVATLHGASFPGAHTFLFKWPLFWLLNLFKVTPASLVIATVAVAVATVGALALVLYKIERRPIIFGTLCLALALVLMMVPTLPYAGGLLPVSMAMLATRNLEYVLYLASLILFIRAQRIRSWQFWAATAVLGLLVASDKLFLSLSVGGSILSLVVYAVFRKWNMVTASVQWLLGGIAAAVIAIVLLGTIQAAGITHIADQASNGPYSATTGSKGFVLGAAYAVLGVLTNFGANPAFDANQVSQLPHHAVSRLASLGGIAYIICIFLVGAAGFAVWKVLVPTLAAKKGRPSKLDRPVELTIMLLSTTVAAVGVFVASNHYYAVDARYLAVSLFAAFIAAATFTRKRVWQPPHVAFAAVICLLGIVSSFYVLWDNTNASKLALSTINQRNVLVADALSHHPVTTLVGDYWRVLPTRLVSGDRLQVTPLANCTELRQALSSQVWQPNLKHHSFAYLLSENGSLTDFPSCSLEQVMAAYGRPNSSLLIAGSLDKPKEQLLFYDHGVQPNVSTQSPANNVATTVPVSLEDIPNVSCSGPTIMNVVAHQDDDILFMNPDLQHDIQAGHCIRTIFLTAGDSGNGKFYWLNRQLGSEAAYDTMLGNHEVWIQRIVRLQGGQYVTIVHPHNNSKISLIFFNLPDGNLQGGGFAYSHNESLSKLYNKRIKSIHAVDGQSSYTAGELKTALLSLMNVYRPAEIRTQASVPSLDFPDHSDHVTTSRFTDEATVAYDQEQSEGTVITPLHHYIGYPIHGYPANVSGEDLQQKEAIFLSYSKFDGGVCHSMAECFSTPTYSAYLSRQYRAEDFPF